MKTSSKIVNCIADSEHSEQDNLMPAWRHESLQIFGDKMMECNQGQKRVYFNRIDGSYRIFDD